MRWKKKTTPRARQLRRNETSPEETLWRWLRARRLQGLKFRRQHPVGPYFLDFGCASVGIAVELDGAGHPARAEYDAARDQYLRDHGWAVLRFGNDDVVLRLHAVLEQIVHAVRGASPLSPTLSPFGREGVFDFTRR